MIRYNTENIGFLEIITATLKMGIIIANRLKSVVVSMFSLCLVFDIVGSLVSNTTQTRRSANNQRVKFKLDVDT